MSTTLQVLMDAAYRTAGLLDRPGWTMGTDYYTADIPAVNRMMASWSIDGHRIYTTSIAEYALVADQKIYTIGPGGDFPTARPIYIEGATILFPTTPVVRREVRILDDAEWRRIGVQDITGAPPFELYYDGGMDANGPGQIYLRFQPPADYKLELYTWLELADSFTDKSDAVVLPPYYEEAIVWNFAIALAAMYPRDSQLSPLAPELARKALAAIIGMNSQSPKMDTEPGLGHGEYGAVRGWLDGGIR